MLLTSLALLVAAIVLIIVGAIKGSVLLLGISVGCGVAGAIALLAANALAPRLARAGGVADPAGPVVNVTDSNGTAPVPLSAWAAADAPPIPGYDEMTAAEVVRVVATGSLAKPALAALLAYEASHETRTTVITGLERALGVKAGAR